MLTLVRRGWLTLTRRRWYTMPVFCTWLKDSDILVLNSLAFANQLGKTIGGYGKGRLLLDNDCAGDRMTNTLLEEHGNLEDGRELFRGFKDLNEKLQDGN